MNNVIPLNLSAMCKMLEILSSSQANLDKKDLYEELLSYLLELNKASSVKEAKTSFEQLKNDTEVVLWYIELLSKEEIFEIAHLFPLVAEIGKPISFKNFITKLQEILKQKNSYISKSHIKKIICYMNILNLVKVTCAEPKILIKNYEKEAQILDNNHMYFASIYKELFSKIVFCVEMMSKTSPSVNLIFENFNTNLYNAILVSNMNELKEKTHKQNKETEEKASNLYSKILEIVGLLIAVFSIIGVNCFTLSSQTNIDVFNILLINSSLVISIVLILFLIHNIIHSNKTRIYYVIFIFTVLFFVGTLIVFFIKNGIIS